MLSCTNEIWCSLPADSKQRIEFMIKPVVENMHSTRTENEDIER